jgi:OmpR family two-component system bacitracin resistance response regulator BceR
VNRLRKKLDEIELGRFIETKVGQGYIALEEEIQ